jgi:hypothetical protein
LATALTLFWLAFKRAWIRCACWGYEAQDPFESVPSSDGKDWRAALVGRRDKEIDTLGRPRIRNTQLWANRMIKPDKVENIALSIKERKAHSTAW